MKKYIFALFIAIFIPSIALCQMSKDQLKQFKKTYNVKSVELVTTPSGYQYYRIEKDNNYGVANLIGRIVVPMLYNSTIEYHPAQSEGYEVSVYSKNVWHPESKASFVVNKYSFTGGGMDTYSSIYLTDGTAVVKDKKGFFSSSPESPGYLTIFDGDETRALYTLDGKLVVEGYSLLKIDDKVCIITVMNALKEKHTMSRKGAMMLDGSMPNVPCEFHEVKYDEYAKKWMVMKDQYTYKWEEYSDNSSGMGKVRDEGTQLYWDGKMDEVIEYYATKGIDKPWAKFFSGAAVMKKAADLNFDIECFINSAKNGKMDDRMIDGRTVRDIYIGKDYDFDLLKRLYCTGNTLLAEYCEIDDEFIEQAKRIMYDDIYRLMELVDEKMAEFNPLWNEFQLQNERIYAEKLRKEEAQRLRERQENAILGGFINALFGAIVNGITSSSSNSSTSVAPSARASQSGYTSGSSSASSSSTKSQQTDNASAADNRKKKVCRACSGLGFTVNEHIDGNYKWCDKCGKSRKPHEHEKCNTCKGKGWHY